MGITRLLSRPIKCSAMDKTIRNIVDELVETKTRETSVRVVCRDQTGI